MTDLCKSCAAPLRWALTRKGHRMPLDAEPTPDGNVRVDRDVLGRDIAVVLGEQERLEAQERGHELWVSHFATCPNATRHRRRNGKGRE